MLFHKSSLIISSGTAELTTSTLHHGYIVESMLVYGTRTGRRKTVGLKQQLHKHYVHSWTLDSELSISAYDYYAPLAREEEIC